MVAAPDVRAAVGLAALRVKQRQDRQAREAARPSYLHDPLGWIDAYVDVELTDYQRAIIGAAPIHRRVSARGPHGLGKTTIEALITIWFAETRERAGLDWKVITMASAWRQLSVYLWPEIHKWVRRVRWDQLGREPWREHDELLDMAIKLEHGQASAAASNNPAYVEGAHADQLLYAFDESKAIPDTTFDAAEGAFSGGGAASETYVLAVSTPGAPLGRFYDIQRRKPGYEDWWTKQVTLADAIAAGRISSDWAEQRRRQWGETSAVYITRVLGNFAAEDEDALIPLAWVEAAQERWHEWVTDGCPGALTAVGVDVGRGGDKSVLALRRGSVIAELRRDGQADTMPLAGRVEGLLTTHESARAVVDVIGIGAGVVDRLRERGHGYRLMAFNASERSERRDSSGELGFTNKRAAAWWRLRELLDPANDERVALPPDDILTGDLTAPRWRVMSGGRIQVESKDDIRKRLGRSTDDGDAVVMAFEEPEIVAREHIAPPMIFGAQQGRRA